MATVKTESTARGRFRRVTNAFMTLFESPFVGRLRPMRSGRKVRRTQGVGGCEMVKMWSRSCDRGRFALSGRCDELLRELFGYPPSPHLVPPRACVVTDPPNRRLDRTVLRFEDRESGAWIVSLGFPTAPQLTKRIPAWS